MKLKDLKVGAHVVLSPLGECTVTEAGGGGYYRTCIKVRSNSGNDLVVKAYACEGVTVPRLEAGDLMRLIQMYAKDLHDVGIATPDPVFWTEARDDGSGRDMVDLYEATAYVGPSIDLDVINGDTDCVRQAVNRVLEHGLAALFSRVPPGENHLPVGIDLVLRNFSWLDGKLYYFDFMPPFVAYDDNETRPLHDRQLLAIPQPTDSTCLQLGQWRHYSKGGLCQVLLIQLARLRPEMCHLFLKWITKFLQENGEWAALQIFNERSAAKLNTHEPGCQTAIDFANEAKFEDVYDLREHACWATHDEKMSREELEDFFLKSHFLGEPLSDTKMDELRSDLISAVN